MSEEAEMKRKQKVWKLSADEVTRDIYIFLMLFHSFQIGAHSFIFIFHWSIVDLGFPSDSVVRNPPAMQETCQEPWVQSRGREDPLEKEWLPTPVFLPGESHEQRSRVGCSPWSCKRVRHDWATKQQELIYRVTLVSGAQTSNSVTHTHVHLFSFRLLSNICYHKKTSIALGAIH